MTGGVVCNVVGGAGVVVVGQLGVQDLLVLGGKVWPEQNRDGTLVPFRCWQEMERNCWP